MLKIQFRDRRQPALWLVDVMSIGSGSRCAIVISDEGVADQHAEICREGDSYYVSDLRSPSGTQVNGRRLTERFQLRPGDRIAIGKSELEVLDPRAAPAQATPATTRPDWSLYAQSGELKGKSFPVQTVVTIGRSAKSDIVLNDEYMSRQHAEFILKGDAFRVVDLDSSNGTYVNGQRIREKVLKPGDKVAFDQNIFIVAGPAVLAAQGGAEEDEATVFRASAPASQVSPASLATPRVRPPAAEKMREQMQAAGPTQTAADERAKRSPGVVLVAAVLLVALAVLAWFSLG